MDDCGSAVADNLGITNQNLNTVEENIAPPAVGVLAINSGLHLLEDQGLTDIKMYSKGAMEGSARALSWVQDFIHMAQPQIMNEEGKLEGSIDMGYAILKYKFETESKYELLFTGGENGEYYLKVNGTDYVMMRNDDGQEHPGLNYIEISYTDEDNWTILDQNTSSICSGVGSVNRAKVMETYGERKGGVWYGKTANFRPFDDEDCSNHEVKDGYFNYTQFVGDDTYTTASGYRMVPLNLANFDSIEDHDIGISGKVNPACLEGDNAPVGQTACSSDNADISTPNYLAHSFWKLPSELADVWNTFPES